MHTGGRTPGAWLVLSLFLFLGILPPSSVPADILPPSSVPAEEAAPFEGWRVIEHERFTFIFEPAHEEVAREAYAVADEVYEQVAESMGYYPRGVPVIIRGRTARANGYYTPFPHQINLFVTAPSEPWLGSREESWIKLLFIHELSHYVHYAHRGGFLGTLSTLFGHDLTAAHAPFYPGWLQEGISTTNETYFTNGGRGRNPFFTMKYRAFLEEGGLWSYRKSKFGSAYAPQDRIYVAGYLYVDYLRQTYGEEVMAEIHEAFALAPFFGVPRAVRLVTGVPARELHARMASRLQGDYDPTSSREGRRRLTPPRPGDWYLPLGTEDGLYYYARSHDDAPGIWRIPPGGTEVARAQRILTVSLTDPYSFTVSGDGGTILFTTVVPDPTHPAGLASFSEVYRLDEGSSVPRRLTFGGRYWHPAVDHSGRKAAVVARNGVFADLHALDLERGESRPLFSIPRATVRHPVFSPSGKSLAFLLEVDGSQELIVAEVEEDGETWRLGDSRLLTGSWDAPVYMPRFASEEVILFSSDPAAGTEVYAADLATGEIGRLLRDPVAAWGALPAPSAEAVGGRAGGVGLASEESGALIYGSYTTTGTSLFLGEAAWEPVGSISTNGEWLEEREVTGAPVGDGGREGDGGRVGDGGTPGQGGVGLPEARRYRDLPEPILWLPLLGAAGTLDGGPALSAGTFLLATSTLQRHQLLGTLLYTPSLAQPNLALSYSFTPGPVSLSGALNYEYEESEGLGAATLQSRGDLSAPIRRDYGVSRTTTIDATIGGGLESTWVRGGSFGIDELGGPRVGQAAAVFGEGGIVVSRNALSPPKAFWASPAERLETTVRYRPALLDRERDAIETLSSVSAVRALGWWHHALGVGVRGATSSRGAAAGLIGPRGGAGWDSGEGDYELIPFLRYFIPLGLWEGRVIGTNVLGGGTFLFAETSFFGTFDGEPDWGEEYYLGAEVNLSMQVFNVLPILGRLGLVSRVDPERGLDDGFEDLFFYLDFTASIPSIATVKQWP